MHRLFWIGWQAGKWFHSAAYNYTGALVFLDQLHTKKEEEEEKSKNLQTLYLEVCHLKQNIHISFNYFQGESPEIVALKTTEEQNVETFFSFSFFYNVTTNYNWWQCNLNIGMWLRKSKLATTGSINSLTLQGNRLDGGSSSADRSSIKPPCRYTIRFHRENTDRTCWFKHVCFPWFLNI